MFKYQIPNLGIYVNVPNDSKEIPFAHNSSEKTCFSFVTRFFHKLISKYMLSFFVVFCMELKRLAFVCMFVFNLF